ncbi:MAG: TIGR00730 family Rossman fold protein [Chitinophagia bacterium]|nr:TIGR00730 family Rossman fold protein [Chitinophagia bacterium]
MAVERIAVFCGSKSGLDPIYSVHAQHLGTLMAAKGKTLVYGGGSVGIMGTVADAVMDGGGKVIGVITELLLTWEQQHTGITDLRVVQDMHTRKKMMYELSDAAIILPGGNGTLDELFEMLTWNTLQIHDKKIVILNSGGYYQHLIAHIQQMQQQGFLYENWFERLLVAENPEQALICLDGDKPQNLL